MLDTDARCGLTRIILDRTCGMMVSLDLSRCSPIELMSLPSMIICPDAASMIRNKDKATDDLPAPVLPTTPTCTKGTKKKNDRWKSSYKNKTTCALL